MNIKRFLPPIVLIAIVLGAAVLYQGSSPSEPVTPVTINVLTVPAVPALDPDEVKRGALVYRDYCASCHGANLEGAPNWKQIQPNGKFPAPPHDSSGHTWHHHDALLLSIITDGGVPQISDMPGFGDTLTHDEMRAVLTFIKTSWGDEEREVQWEITEDRQ
jgi:mono/diheme cytochrome c family protein